MGVLAEVADGRVEMNTTPQKTRALKIFWVWDPEIFVRLYSQRLRLREKDVGGKEMGVLAEVADGRVEREGEWIEMNTTTQKTRTLKFFILKCSENLKKIGHNFTKSYEDFGTNSYPQKGVAL